MGTNRYGRRTSSRESVIAIAVISLVGQFGFGGLTGRSVPKLDPRMAQLSNSLPSKIITTDGMTYNAVKLSRIEPDGLLVEFRPVAGGAGLAKLKFARLPESLQRQFGYDPLKASAYEQEQVLVMSALSQKLQQDEKTRLAVLTAMARPNLARFVFVNSADPTVTYTYYGPGLIPAVVGSNSVGVIEHKFKCHSDFDFNWKPNAAGQPIHFYIETATILLGLSFNITQPDHPLEKGRIHEEGHRKIYEYFYRFGPKVARQLGESMIGRDFTSHATDFETVRAEVLLEAGNAVEREYLARIDQIAREANRYYDQITDHARNNIGSDQAVQEAIAKFGKDFSN